MRGYSDTKSSSFPFGVYFHKNNSPSEDYGDYRASVYYKALCSWLNFRSVGSIAEVEKIRNVFSAMFQANHKQMVKKHKKRKHGEMPHIIKIDLAKIDENLKLSKNEKRRLRRIISQIKYRENGSNSDKKKIKRGNEKSLALRRPNKTEINEKTPGRNKKKLLIEKSKEKMSWERSDCKHCTLCSKTGNESHTTRHQRRHVTNVTPSEERILKTLINLDRRCCGESFRTIFDSKGRKTFISQKHNINIENLEFKYIQPTCLMQYGELREHVSDYALNSHLGSKPVPKVSHSCFKDQPSKSRMKSIHYDDDKRNSSIKSLTDLLNNQSITYERSTNKGTMNKVGSKLSSPSQQKLVRQVTWELDIEEHVKSLKLYRDEMADGYSEDSETELRFEDLTMSPQQTSGELEKKRISPNPKETGDKYSIESEVPKGIKRNKTKCQKFMNFAKKCFCICGNENDSETDLFLLRDNEIVNARLRKRLNSTKLKVVRMTEEEFRMKKES